MNLISGSQLRSPNNDFLTLWITSRNPKAMPEWMKNPGKEKIAAQFLRYHSCIEKYAIYGQTFENNPVVAIGLRVVIKRTKVNVN